MGPGQSRRVSFQLDIDSPAVEEIELGIDVERLHGTEYIEDHTLSLRHKLRSIEGYGPHLVTHIGPSETVSYSILRPPPLTKVCPDAKGSAPVLLLLHGAGVNVSEPMTIEAVRSMPEICVWTVVPQGLTTWSSDDWREYPCVI